MAFSNNQHFGVFKFFFFLIRPRRKISKTFRKKNSDSVLCGEVVDGVVEETLRRGLALRPKSKGSGSLRKHIHPGR